MPEILRRAPFRFSVQGNEVASVFLDLASFVGPASYATGGIPVDLSARFATILGVAVARVYATGTKQGTGRVFEVVETGTDVFASGRFRVVVRNPFAGFTPAGAVSQPAFTGTPAASGAPSATTPVGSSAHTHQYDKANSPTGPENQDQLAGVPNTHTHTLSYTSTASGAPSATTNVGDATHTHTTTATGSVSTPTFTGTPQGALDAAEVPAGTVLSGVTFELMVFGLRG